MANKKINQLLNYAAQSGRPINRRVNKTAMQAITRDMKQLVAAEKEGHALPTRQRIADYIESNHNVIVSPRTIGDWLNKVRKGQPIV